MPKSNTFLSSDILSDIATYQSGIAQASAHRAINRLVSDYLLRYGLSAMQWFAIGTIYDAGDQGIRITDLSKKLGTTVPYITNTITLLESKGMIQKVTHEGDSRIKLVTITPKYKRTVQSIEEGLRDYMRVMLYQDGHISRDELKAYIAVLYKIIEVAP